MKEKILGVLICGIMILGTTGCNDKKESTDNPSEVQNKNEEKILACLENELGGYLVTEKDTLSDIPLKEITDKEDQLAYYKGSIANKNNLYVIYKGDSTDDYEVIKDFDLYFANRFPTYQKFEFANTGIYILIHNNFNDIDYESVKERCEIKEGENVEKKEIPSKTIDNINKTKSIVIKSNDQEIGTIDKKDVIADVINKVSLSTQPTGKDIVFLCDGNAFDFELYDEDNKLIDTLYVWGDGKRIMPKSISGGCSYYYIPDDKEDLRYTIEQETDYVFFDISDYQGECSSTGDKEFIYQDKKYKYYLNRKKCDEVLINFELNNLTMTIKNALNDGHITPDQLSRYENLLLKQEK